MKFVFATALALAAAVRSQESSDSSDNSSEGTGQALTGDGARSIKSSSMMLSRLELNDDSQIKNYKKTLNDYGCYCFITNNGIASSHVGGSGIPVDALDAACRDLYLAYTCLEMDVESGSYSRSCSHTGSFSWYQDVNNVIQCGKDDGGNWGSNAKNTCKMDLCAVEKKFADTVHALFQGGFAVDENNYGAAGLGNCQKVAGAAGAGVAGASQCCGSYPNRKTAPAGANVECCGANGKSYNTLTHDCCAGSPAALGAC
jgi:hypothetical protein